MAVQLPSFADVGIGDPRSVGTQPTYPQNDAVAEGEAALGKGIEKAGGAIEDYAADDQRKKSKLEQANATTDLFIRLTPLHEQISKETDPAKLAELRTQYDQLLPTSGTAISDPYARKLWEATHAKAIFQANADADSRKTVLDRNRADAQVFGLIDQAVRVGAAADDPQAFANAKLAVKNNLDYLQQYGSLLPTQRYEAEKKATTDLVAGRIDALANKGRVDEASALLNQYRTDLGAVAAANLEHKIETRGSAIRVDGVVNGLIGGAAPGKPQAGDAVDRFLNLAEAHESGGKNIPQGVVGPNGGYNPSTGGVTGPSSAQGYFQITNSTWKSFAPNAGVDLGQYPNAMAAPYDVQRQVARTIATTDGVQHWTNFNSTLKAAVQAEGLPVSGPIDSADATPVGSKAAPIPTGPQAAQPPAGAASPPNRTGLRLPEEVAPLIMSDPRLRNEQERYQALQHYEARYKSQEATQAQLERVASQRAQQQLRDAENEAWKDVYSANPKLTPQIIANDPRFNIKPESRKAIIDIIENPPGSGIPAPQSYAAAQSLIDRIRLPYGDKDKITTPDEIWANHRLMNKPDIEFALKTLNDSLSPGREKFTAREKAFLDGVKPEIDRSGVMPGLPNDGKGRLKYYEFQNALDTKIDAYLKAGKDPNDLLDPSKPDYMAKPESLKPYRRSIAEALADFQNDMQGGAGATNAFGPASAVDLSKIGSLGDMQAAVKKDPSLRDRAIAISIEKGWIAPPAAAPEPAVAPPIR